MTSKHGWKVALIPWDHKSTEHITRLYAQRVACGWAAEGVPHFVRSAEKGEKVFYWIILTDEVPEQETLLARHVAKYPKEASRLTDTANEVLLASRVPSEKQFTPIGHVALSTHSPDEDEKLGLPRSGVAWVHTLYISYALQKGGFGTAAMSRIEQLTTLKPFNASVMALDAVAKEIMLDEALLKIVFDGKGLPRPVISNEEWYNRLGYEIFAQSKEGVESKNPGGTVNLKVVFLRKNLR